MVEVVGLDVGDDARLGWQGEERAVALVGLGDEDVAGAEVGVAAGLVELAADRERRVGAAVLQRDGEHRGGRGLAVRARDGDAAVARHDGGERLGAAHHAHAALAGRDPLGVVSGMAVETMTVSTPATMLGVVADAGVDADGPQRREPARVLGVAAGHRDAAGDQDAGDAGHAGAADARRRGRARAPVRSGPRRRSRACLLPLPRGRRGPAARPRRARPCAYAAAPIARSLVSSSSSGDDRFGEPLRGEGGVVDEEPAAGVDDRQRVEPLLAVADGQRARRSRAARRRPARRRSSRRRATERHVGRGVGEVHAVEVGHGDVRRSSARAGALVAGPDGVQHLDALRA